MKYKLSKSKFGITLRAEHNIRKGEFLFADKGPVSETQTKHSYQVDWDKHCEPEGPSAYLNHSCHPNTGIKVKKGGHPRFYAIRNIAKDEELVVDYGTFEYKTKVLSEVDCLCGAEKCRKRIRGFVDLSPEKIASYGIYIADYLRESAK